MMTTTQALAMADALQPNAYQDTLKLRWLSELDGMIYREVFAWHEGAPPERAPYGAAEATLLVGEPYSTLYTDYLLAMMNMHDAEFDRYTNAMLRFNSAYSAFADAYNRTHRPLQPRPVHY